MHGTPSGQFPGTLVRSLKADARPPLLSKLPRFSLGLLEPKIHIQLAVHRHRGGEVVLRRLALTCVQTEPAKAEVAVGDERAHAALGRKREPLAIMLLCGLDLRGVAM